MKCLSNPGPLSLDSMGCLRRCTCLFVHGELVILRRTLIRQMTY